MSLFGTHKPRQQHFPKLQSGHVITVATQNDIRTTTGHVGGDGDGSGAAGLSNDFGFPLHVFRLCIEKIVWHLLLRQQGGEQFRLFYACGAHQYRPPDLMNIGGFQGHSTPFGCLRS